MYKVENGELHKFIDKFQWRHCHETHLIFFSEHLVFSSKTDTSLCAVGQYMHYWVSHDK